MANLSLIESICRKQGYAIATPSAPSVPVYILRCKLQKRLKILATIHIEDDAEREEMIYRITTRCDKAHKDKEYFLLFLDEHRNHAELFDQSPASVFFEFQRWKKDCQLSMAA